jgi:hypothetical protein
MMRIMKATPHLEDLMFLLYTFAVTVGRLPESQLVFRVGVCQGVISVHFDLASRSVPDIGSLYRPDRSITSSPDLPVP